MSCGPRNGVGGVPKNVEMQRSGRVRIVPVVRGRARVRRGGLFHLPSRGLWRAVDVRAGRGPRVGRESPLSWAQRPHLMNLHWHRCSASTQRAKGKSSSTSTGPRLAWFSRATSCPSQPAPVPPHQQPPLPLGEATTTARSEGGSHRQSQGKSSVKKRSAGGSSTPPKKALLSAPTRATPRAKPEGQISSVSDLLKYLTL